MAQQTITDSASGCMFDLGVDVVPDGCSKCRATGMTFEPEDLHPEPSGLDDLSCDAPQTFPVRVKCVTCNGTGHVPGAGPLIVATVFQLYGDFCPLVVVNRQ